MQKLNENFNGFSSPCMDNSAKIDEKNVSKDGASAKFDKNGESSTELTENIDTSHDFLRNFEKNSTSNEENSTNDTKNTALQPYSNDYQANCNDFQPKANDNGNNDVLAGENTQNSSNSASSLTFEEVIERDFNDFALIYPNVSKKSLLNNENLKLFAEGKENKSISVIYAKFRKIADSIASEAVLQEKSRQANASSRAGALASTQNANSPFFTREQVKNMTPKEIKENYELIRKSQAKW